MNIAVMKIMVNTFMSLAERMHIKRRNHDAAVKIGIGVFSVALAVGAVLYEIKRKKN